MDETPHRGPVRSGRNAWRIAAAAGVWLATTIALNQNRRRAIPAPPRGIESIRLAAAYAATPWLVPRAGHTDLFRFDLQVCQARLGGFIGSRLGPPDRGREG